MAQTFDILYVEFAKSCSQSLKYFDYRQVAKLQGYFFQKKMRYIIPKSNIKVFHKAIQALGKVGEELYFEPGPDTLFIKALNSGK